MNVRIKYNSVTDNITYNGIFYIKLSILLSLILIKKFFRLSL